MNIKNLRYTAGLFLICFQLQAQQIRHIKANVSKAVVYLQGARLFSSATLILPTGTTTLSFDGVSPSINTAALNAGGKGPFTILETRYEQVWKEKEPKRKTEPLLKAQLHSVIDSIEDIGFHLEDLNNLQSTLETEKRILLSNRLMTGQTQRDSLPLLRESLIFLRERLNNINTEQSKIAREKHKTSKLLTRLETRKNDLELLMNGNPENGAGAESVSSVLVDIYCEAPCTATVQIAYLVNNAGWIPQYELHGSGSKNGITLKQMASIFQTTGVPWDDAQLILSTGNPSAEAVKPVPGIWYIGYYRQKLYKTEEMSKRPMPAASQKSNSIQEDDMGNFKALEDQVEVNQSMILTEYQIALKHRIPSDGKAHHVMVQSKELPGIYYYAILPRLDLKAYLMAKVTGWDDLNLLTGRAYIYFDGNPAGTTFINPDATQDTMEINMGRDNGSLTVSRKPLKETSKDKLLHDKKERGFGFEIVVRNNRNQAVMVTIEDQIPVVQPGNDGLKVVLNDDGDAQVDPETGKLTWEIKLNERETFKRRFRYTVISEKGASWSGN